MKKAIKIILVILLSLLAVFLTSTALFFAITANAKLQPQKLIDYGKSISIYDDEGNKIEDASVSAKRKSVRLSEINSDTVNAFIASEDRQFYSHNGLNYKRMIKAFIKNVSSFSFKEGASTISQQLIKNTHLTGDKKISRKLKEIRLTKQLERRYSKDEILEMYLNTIYFGHNCYGLQSAAEFYFGKNAEELDLTESATIVGLLSSPNNYSPFKNPEKCLQKRNTVLNAMAECGFIDSNRCDVAKNSPLVTERNDTNNKFYDYYEAIFDELEQINLTDTDLSACKIETYLNKEAQNAAENLHSDSDRSIVIRSREGGVAAFVSTIGQAKRQIGSTAKPIFVYAPAIEEKKLHLFTKIEDEQINFGGYSPENFDKKYRGKVTVEESIAQSLNIPAVKTLNSIGVNTADKYAKLMDVNLDDDEKNLSLALGGMKYGMTLKELCDCYSVFENGGIFKPSRFIKKITSASGKILYENRQSEKHVFSDGTASIINDALCKTAKTGTAKRLKNFNFDVACKTGTCGTIEGNTDAYAISYTSDYCIGVWLGDKDNKKLPIYGGNQCCELTEQILKQLYKDKTPEKLEKNSGTEMIEIDREEYEKNDKIILADNCSPALSRLKVKCLQKNIPVEQSTRFSLPTIRKPQIIVNNDNICIQLCQTKYYSYIVNRVSNGEKVKIFDGKWKECICDKPPQGNYVYEVIPYYDDGKIIHMGNAVALPRVNFSPETAGDKIPDIAFKDWYNQ